MAKQNAIKQFSVHHILMYTILIGFAFIYSQNAWCETNSLPTAPFASANSIQMRNQSLAPGLTSLTGIVNTTVQPSLKVLVHQKGKPIAHKPVVFKILLSPQGATNALLSKPSTTTNSDGLAQTTFQLGSKSGTYIIGAFFEGSLNVEPVRFVIVAQDRAWGVFLLFGLLGGLAIFLLGMNLSEDGLKGTAGNQIKPILSALSANRVLALFMGMIATALLQSSSASTVMLVGFVEATAIHLSQAIGILLGAKIGTTITTQLIAFNLSKYSLLLVAVGFLLRVIGKKKKVRKVGDVILGFGMIFFGLGVMAEAMRPLRTIPQFSSLLLRLNHYPIAAIIISILFTAVVQSSAATIGLAIALCASHLLTLEAALPLAWGAHIGTCATAFLASIGTSRAGKQVALAHLLVSTFGVLLAYPFLSQFVDASRWLTALIGSSSPARELANGHMIFTIITGLVLLPFISQIKWLTEKILPLESTSICNFRPKYLNEASTQFPSLALDLAHREILRLTAIVRAMLAKCILLLEYPSEEAVLQMDKEDDKVDILEKAIRPYLAKVAQENLSNKLISKEHAFIYIVQELEGIGDIVTREIARSSKKLDRRSVAFSSEGLVELKQYHQVLMNKFDSITQAVQSLDSHLAEQILGQSEGAHVLERSLKQAHLERLHNGLEETVATSAYHLSTLNNMRAISERIDDMARTIVEELKNEHK